ncbi:MAG: DUF4276 family protein [Planctomycetaceae bacterium]
MGDETPGRRAVRIAIIVEGDTEKVFMPILRNFLLGRLKGKMPKLDPVPRNGLIPIKNGLKKLVNRLFNDRRAPADAIIALTDVYTGMNPPRFQDADDAIQKMKNWVGANEDRFFPHAASYEFEAWLLPYWNDIQRLAGHNKKSPGKHPEKVNHNKPPSHHLKEIFEAGTGGSSYSKIRDAKRILQGKDLLVAARQCPELKSLLNTILQLCKGELIP